VKKVDGEFIESERPLIESQRASFPTYSASNASFAFPRNELLKR
jgi:hypothetical protein